MHTTALLSLLTLISSALEDDPAIAAARARQEAMRTIYLRFKRTEVVVPGGISDDNPTRIRAGLPWNGVPVPRKEMVLESIGLLVFDGPKHRIESEHPVLSFNGSLVIDKSFVKVSNGFGSASLFPHGFAGAGEPEAMLDPVPRHYTQEPLGIMAPVLLTFRGSDLDTVTKWTRTGKSLDLDGATCLEYTDGISLGVHYWLDPERGYIVRRILWEETRIRSRGQLEVNYRTHDTWGWLPETWTLHRIAADEKILRTEHIEVLQLWINAPQSPELFDLMIPKGCQIVDNTTSPPKEYRVTANTLLSELFPLEPPNASFWRYRWQIAGGILILAGLAWHHVVRRRRRSTN